MENKEIKPEETNGESKDTVCKCGREVDGEMHTCPYAEDINNDSESLCNCCNECIHECCMDI